MRVGVNDAKKVGSGLTAERLSLGCIREEIRSITASLVSLQFLCRLRFPRCIQGLGAERVKHVGKRHVLGLDISEESVSIEGYLVAHKWIAMRAVGGEEVLVVDYLAVD